MCLYQQHNKYSVAVSPAWQETRRHLIYVITFFVFTIAMSFLHAQSQSEDYMMVKNWNLPEDAVLLQELQLKNGVLFREDEAFTGWVYELYPKGELLRASEYRKGHQHGQSLLWYPDGTPQMSAFYRNGALHGRFLGWYQNGLVIYDMFINRGTYASDNLAENDELRQEEVEVTEREGNTDDATRE